MAAAADYSDAHAGRAVLVLHNGDIAFERYSHGWTAEKPHPLASGTKSFNGVLAMCAIEDGLITSLDETVCDTILEWKDDPRKKDITVRHLLTLSSGLQPNHASLGSQGAGIRDISDIRNANDGPIAKRIRAKLQNERPADRFAAAVRVPSEQDPGAVFRYGPTHFYAFGEFLERKLKTSDRGERSYWEYLRNRVLQPCGIDIGIERFAPDAANKPNLPGGGHLTAREWSRFGAMIAQGGTIDDSKGCATKVLAEERLAECFVPSTKNSAYGLTWWLLTGNAGSVAEVADAVAVTAKGQRVAAQTAAILDRDGKPLRIVMAAGAGKQRLYVLPDFDLVIVRFAAMGKDGSDFDDGDFLRTMLGLTKPDEATAPPTIRLR